VQTPAIDGLAAEGMRFTNVCCCNSICSPSRASIITGQYSHTNGGRTLNCSLQEDAPSYNRIALRLKGSEIQIPKSDQQEWKFLFPLALRIAGRILLTRRHAAVDPQWVLLLGPWQRELLTEDL